MPEEVIKAIFTGPKAFKIFSIFVLIIVIIWTVWKVSIALKKEQVKDKQIDSIQETVESTKQIITRQLEQADSDNYTRLIQKYPLGYCLFAVDHKKIIIPYESRLESDIKIDWSKAKVVKLTSERVVVLLPHIIDNVDYIEIKGIAVENTRQVGSVRVHFGGKGHHGPQILTEVVANDEKGVILALGFKD